MLYIFPHFARINSGKSTWCSIYCTFIGKYPDETKLLHIDELQSIDENAMKNKSKYCHICGDKWISSSPLFGFWSLLGKKGIMICSFGNTGFRKYFYGKNCFKKKSFRIYVSGYTFREMRFWEIQYQKMRFCEYGFGKHGFCKVWRCMDWGTLEWNVLLWDDWVPVICDTYYACMYEYLLWGIDCVVFWQEPAGFLEFFVIMEFIFGDFNRQKLVFMQKDTSDIFGLKWPQDLRVPHKTDKDQLESQPFIQES